MRQTFTPLLVALLVLPTVLLLGPTAAATGPLPASCIAQTSVDVVLVMDRSGSMTDQNRMVLAQGAANELLDTLLPLDQSALVSFASDVRMDKSLDTLHVGALPSTEGYVNALTPGGGTQIWKGIRMATYELTNHGPFGPSEYSNRARLYGGKPVMVVLTDGDQNDPYPRPQDEAWYAKNAGITVFSIVLGDTVSASGRAEMKAVASSPGHYFEVADGDPLNVVFLAIGARIRDLTAPTVAITRPDMRLYDADVDVGPTPVSLPAINGAFTPGATAADDCLMDRVEFSVAAYDDYDAFVGIVSAGVDASAPYHGHFDCDALAGGRHVLRATAYDFDGKSATTSEPFYCIRAAVDARGTAFFARLTNPVGPNVTDAGAALPSPFGGGDESVFANKNGPMPIPHDASLLYDLVNGSAWLDAGRADALSRVSNATFPSLPLHVEAIETTAAAWVDLTTFHHDGTFQGVRAEHAPDTLDVTPGGCTMLMTDLPATAAVDPCLGDVSLQGDATLVWDERIVETREGFLGYTVNGAHLLVDRPEGRLEVILGQSYVGVSFLGPRGLVSGPARATDAQSDAGTGADAPGTASGAIALTPGVHGGRVADASDVDAYAFDVAIGEKLHVEIVPAHEANVVLMPGPAATPTPFVVRPRATLLDPQLAVRDDKASLLGAPVEVELNVDETGRWVVLVWDAGGPGDYTLIASITPIGWPQQNDALLEEDASATCTDAPLVGPGAHVGAIEPGDVSDVYRVQVFEGQALAVALRPGDTADAADMDLYVYDPACNLLASSTGTSVVKGKPEVVTLGTSTLGGSALPPGLYRVEVRYVSGLGSYELAVSTSVAVQWT